MRSRRGAAARWQAAAARWQAAAARWQAGGKVVLLPLSAWALGKPSGLPVPPVAAVALPAQRGSRLRAAATFPPTGQQEPNSVASTSERTAKMAP